MNKLEDIELHELHTIEDRLCTEVDADAAHADAFMVNSASGFMVNSASGFMVN